MVDKFLCLFICLFVFVPYSPSLLLGTYFPSRFSPFAQVSAEQLRTTQWWLQPTWWPVPWELLINPQ